MEPSVAPPALCSRPEVQRKIPRVPARFYGKLKNFAGSTGAENPEPLPPFRRARGSRRRVLSRTAHGPSHVEINPPTANPPHDSIHVRRADPAQPPPAAPAAGGRLEAEPAVLRAERDPARAGDRVRRRVRQPHAAVRG